MQPYIESGHYITVTIGLPNSSGQLRRLPPSSGWQGMLVSHCLPTWHAQRYHFCALLDCKRGREKRYCCCCCQNILKLNFCTQLFKMKGGKQQDKLASVYSSTTSSICLLQGCANQHLPPSASTFHIANSQFLSIWPLSSYH